MFQAAQVKKVQDGSRWIVEITIPIYEYEVHPEQWRPIVQKVS